MTEILILFWVIIIYVPHISTSYSSFDKMVYLRSTIIRVIYFLCFAQIKHTKRVVYWVSDSKSDLLPCGIAIYSGSTQATETRTKAVVYVSKMWES